MGGSVALDTLLELCRSQYRRIILAALADHQQPLTVSELTTMICNQAEQPSCSGPSPDSETEVIVSLHHGHIPKLVAHDVIDYNASEQLVTSTETLEQQHSQLVAILEAERERVGPLESSCVDVSN